MKPTTEEESTPVDPLGRRSLPRKVSNLRRGLGQKAKQELFHRALVEQFESYYIIIL